MSEVVEHVDGPHLRRTQHLPAGGEASKRRQVSTVGLERGRRQLALDLEVIEELLDSEVERERRRADRGGDHSAILDPARATRKFWSISAQIADNVAPGRAPTRRGEVMVQIARVY